MNGHNPPAELTFADYLRPVWRFRVFVLCAVIATTMATYVYYNRQAPLYETATELYVGQSDVQQLLSGGLGSASSERSIANQARLLTSPRVAERVRARLKLDVPAAALLGSVTSTANSNSDFLVLRARDGDPQRAAELANGFAASYLSLRRSDLVAAARTALRDVRARLRRLPRSSTTAVTRTALTEQINTLQGTVASPPGSGEQVTRAGVPGAPVAPKPRRAAFFAALLALVLSIIVCYLLDRSDRRVRRLEEVETLFDLPVLASIPHVRQASAPKTDPGGTQPALREPHRTLRVNLDLARSERPMTTILVTSALPAEGKSTVVRNLAISYREAGARVAVVEADLRRPVLAKQFGLPTHFGGINESLARGVALTPQTVLNADPGQTGRIDVFPAGPPLDNPTVLLTEERLIPIIEPIAAAYDIVLIDSPPLLSVSDALPLLNLVDGVVIVVRPGTTTHPAVERVRRTIERLPRANLIGAVANDVTDTLNYGYSYGPGDKRPHLRPVADKPAAGATAS